MSFIDLIFFLYLCAAVGLFMYGMNCYWLLTIFLRNKRREVCYRTRHDGFGYRTDQGYKLMPLGF